MNGDARVFFPTGIVCVFPSAQVTGKLAGNFVVSRLHLTLIKMVLLLLFLVPSVISDLFDFFLNNKKT